MPRIREQSIPLSERAALHLKGQAEDYSGLGTSTLYSLARTGKIEFLKAGARTLVWRASLDAYLQSLRSGVTIK